MDEFETIKIHLKSLARDCDLLLQFGKELEISGNIEEVTNYCERLATIKGHVALCEIALERLKGNDTDLQRDAAVEEAAE